MKLKISFWIRLDRGMWHAYGEYVCVGTENDAVEANIECDEMVRSAGTIHVTIFRYQQIKTH